MHFDKTSPKNRNPQQQENLATKRKNSPIVRENRPTGNTAGIRQELRLHSTSRSSIVQRLIEFYKSVAACRSHPTPCSTDTAGVKFRRAAILQRRLKVLFFTKLLVAQLKCATGFLHPCAMLKQAIRNIPYLRVLLRMTCLLCAHELMCPLA